MKRYRNIMAVMRIENETGIINEHVFYLLNKLKEYIGGILILSKIKLVDYNALRLCLGEVVFCCDNDNWETVLLPYEKVLVFDEYCFGPTDAGALEGLLKYLGSKPVHSCELIPGHCVMLESRAFVEGACIMETESGKFVHRLWDNARMEGVWKSPSTEPIFFNIESLMDTDINVSSCEASRSILEIIMKTSFDTSLIWDYLLDRFNVSDIKNALHLEYIFPWKSPARDIPVRKEKKAALVAHLYYRELAEECLGYLKQVPFWMDIYITTSNWDTKAEIEAFIAKEHRENWRIIWKDNRGRDVSALLVACHSILMQYEYLGFIHDKKSADYLAKKSEAASFQYNIWENTVKSREYIYQVLQCFADNPQLGLLVPPEPYYASLMGYLGKSWGRCYDATREFAGMLRLDCQMTPDKLPITVSTAFWCRTKALEPLFTYPFRYEDFPQEPMDADGTFSHVIEHILAYVAQHQRFFTGIMMNVDYASLRGNGLQMLLISALNEIRKESIILKPKDITDFRGKTQRMLTFCKKFSSVFIYGMGTYGRRCYNVLSYHNQSVTGYLVSDGKETAGELDGLPVYHLSEIHVKAEHCGILLALNTGNQRQVIPLLEQAGFRNWISILEPET